MSTNSYLQSCSFHSRDTGKLKSTFKNVNILLAFSFSDIHGTKEIIGTGCTENKTEVIINNVVLATILYWLPQS